jgi:sec-independent protein translocase protein TatA
MLQNFVNLIPSGFELIIIVAVIAGILLIGAKKIPEIAKTLGRSRMEYEKGKFEAEKEFKDLKEKKD